jgi:hypothetical protein
VIAAASCGRGEAVTLTQDRPASSTSATIAAATPGPFDARMLEIARDYPRWTRIRSSLAWALADCDVPIDRSVFASRSEDDATHGRKLYYLFARDAAAYARREGSAAAGQTLVKESWTPVEVAPDAGHPITEVAVRDGKPHRAGARTGLFVMTKLDPATPETDGGWVYGIVSGDGARVIAAGRLGACAGCHAGAPRDRLFGPPL